MSNSRTIPSLDGLRAIAIGLVLLGHVDHTRNAPPLPELVGPYADFGVRVFFVISGFLITQLLLDEQAKTGGISLKNFYLRRAFRILPAAYVFLLVVTILGRSQFGRLDLLLTWGYLKCYYMEHGPFLTGHLWSLSVEEQFYLLWPLVMALAFRRKVVVAGAVAVAGPFVRALYYARHWANPRFAFPAVADALAVGCLLAVLQPWLDRRAERLYGRWFFMVPLTALAIPAIPHWLPASIGGSWVWRSYDTLGLSVMCLCIALSIDNAVRRRYRFLNARPVVWVGILSYSLYLWQQPFLDREIHGWWTAFPQNVACAFGCALVSYYLVEQPFLRLREKFRERPSLSAGIEVPAEAAV